MKSIKVTAPGKLEILNESIPLINGEKDVLIRVRAAGICGSDISIYKGTSPVATYPRIIGHEFAGEVIAIGEGVTKVQPGDHVTVNPVIACGSCLICKNGRSNVCSNLHVIGVHEDGGYCDVVRVPDANVYKVSSEMPFEHAAIVEPYTVAAQVADRGNVSEGNTVLILGSGQIALTILQVCKLLKARCIMTDLIDERLERAMDYGADITINTSYEDIHKKIMEVTNGIGVDVSIDAACVGKTLEQAALCTRPAGVIVTMGFSNQQVPITELDITKKELDIRGSRLNNNKFPQVIQWFEEKKIDPSRIITDHFHFTEVLKGMNKIKNDPEHTMKVILTF